MISLYDYLNEDDNRETLFQRAKRLALSLARRNNRSDNGIRDSDNASELERRIGNWANSPDPKVKAAYNDIRNILKGQAEKADKKAADKVGKKNDSGQNSQNGQNNQNDSGNDTDNQNDQNGQNDSENGQNSDETENLSPEQAQNLEIAKEREKEEMEKYSEILIKNEEKKMQSAHNIADFLSTLINLIAPDVSANPNLSNMEDSSKNKIEAIKGIGDTITNINDQYDALENDYKTKVEAQEAIYKAKELEYQNKNAPEVDRKLREQKTAIDHEIASEIRNADLLDEYNDYKNLLSNADYLNDEQQQRLEQYKNGRIGQIINTAKEHNQIMSQHDIDEINKRFRDTELARIKETVKQNKEMFKAEYEASKKKFDIAIGDTLEKLHKAKTTLEKGGKFKAEDNKDLADSLKSSSKHMQKIISDYSKVKPDDSKKKNNSNGSNGNGGNNGGQ